MTLLSLILFDVHSERPTVKRVSIMNGVYLQGLFFSLMENKSDVANAPDAGTVVCINSRSRAGYIMGIGDKPYTYTVSVESVYISGWFPIEAQVNSPVVIPHPIGQIPAKVEVQVKVQESGNDVIFPASGSAQRDDDSDNVYGGVVYLYNELHVKVFVPLRDENSYKGVMIYTGGSTFAGPFQANYVRGVVRIKVWGLCDLPPANFTTSGGHSISKADNYKSITHGLGRYPDFVVVQLKLSNGYISEAGGVTFNSISEAYQSICGTVFAYNDQEFRLWTLSGPTDNYVACARDGWGTEELQSYSATIYIQAWVLEPCNKLFSTSFIMDKNNVDVSSPTKDRVKLDSTYPLDSTIISVQMKVFTSNNNGFVFYAGGSAMIDNSADPYGAIIYGYSETEVLLWRPDPTNTNGYLVYVDGEWGGGTSNQQSTLVEVTVQVISLSGSPCTGTNECSPMWTSLTTMCTPTDCPIPGDIANAYKLYDGITNGSTAMYSCKPGYTESSYDVLINCEQGTWSTTTMFCKVVCPQPPAIANAAVSVQNNVAKYYCLAGFFAKVNTNDIITCVSNVWPATDFECIQTCPAPVTIPNADVMVFNNLALYSCSMGFLPTSSRNSINCTNSVWQTTDFSCQASTCGPAPNISNADVMEGNDKAMYACHYGFHPTTSNNVILCGSGQWSSTSLQCQESSSNNISFISNNTLQEWIDEIKRKLLLDKKKTNAYNRSLSSAYDPRQSSIVIGSSGAILLIVAILLFVLLDLINFFKFLNNDKL